MSNLPNPYRESGIESTIETLQEDEVSNFITNIYDEPLERLRHKQGLFTVTADIEDSILNIGYKQLRQGIYIRESAFLPSFPDGKRLVEDRFAAAYPGFFDMEKILVSGKLDRNLETTLRDIEILGDIFENSVSYAKKWWGYTQRISLWAGLAYASVIPEVVFENVRACYRNATKMPHINKLKEMASGLSRNSKDYLYGGQALENIRDEALDVRVDSKKLLICDKLKSAGIIIRPQEFDYLSLAAHGYSYNGRHHDLVHCFGSQFDYKQREIITRIFKEVE